MIRRSVTSSKACHCIILQFLHHRELLLDGGRKRPSLWVVALVMGYRLADLNCAGCLQLRVGVGRCEFHGTFPLSCFFPIVLAHSSRKSKTVRLRLSSMPSVPTCSLLLSGSETSPV